MTLHDFVLIILGVALWEGVTDLIGAAVRRRRAHAFREHLKQAPAQPLRAVQIPSAPTVTRRTVDPERPPSYVIHVQAPGDPVTLCTCHHKPIADGDRVLLWPGVELLCEDTYGFLDKGREV